jgi:protein TonB
VSTAAHHVIATEELAQVEFAPPPPEPIVEPPPPPVVAPPPDAPPPRIGRPRPRLEQPDEIPEERPEESDGELSAAGDGFAPEQEGVAAGSATGTGTVAPAPPPEPEPVRPRGPVRVVEGTTPPSFDRAEIARNFEIPDAVRSAGIARITVVVRVTVEADGSLGDVAVLRGHDLIPNDNVLRAVRACRFQPARFPDGTAYAAIQTFPITIAVQI